MSQPPVISVIVPVYNVEDHVAACIQSLRDQSHTDFEVIVVDDGATDDSYGAAVVAIDGDPRFGILRQTNGGLSAARNAGLAVAQGQFIAFVDSDDVVAPDYLSLLLTALTSTGADWAACGVRSVYPGGGHTDHSAIHSSPKLDEAAPQTPHLMPLKTWAQVIDHFPSAWNKLYRAKLIKGLRFDEGTLFEDHAFFHQAACRTQTIAHVPAPLYLQTRERAGQITGEDSPRIFDQFDVLERLSLLMNADKPGGVPAYGALASRLLYERLSVIRDPDRRAAFLAEAAKLLKHHNLRYLPDWDAGVGASAGLELASKVPLSIVIPWDGDADALRATLASLAAAQPCGAQIIVSCDRVDVGKAQSVIDELPTLIVTVVSSNTPGAGAARMSGLAQAIGTYAIFLDAGDLLAPSAQLQMLNSVLHHSADLGLAPMRIGTGPDAGIHNGFHDIADLPPKSDKPQIIEMTADIALSLYCHPSAKIISRNLITQATLKFGNGPLADWSFFHRAALRAGRVLHLAHADVTISQRTEDRRQWLAPIAPAALARAVADASTDLPSGAEHRLLGRALWEKLFHTSMNKAGKVCFLLQAARVISKLPPFPEGARLDPYIGKRLTRLMQASGRSQWVCISRALGR
ncbi:hypothetical protein C1J03_19610 [Sulfitobacter sp. SK012]|uniref:glycosyltransferase family 2 protein n=1 Tax=Sulfitobacter sp. SK012 TaxID=1389005 RepID=UPI000E0C7C4B|nr:glycosyltransferase [Sulfitobacter sp. SK012]AXI48011.1 hypothetical protein C1J03_19610 [Sulfitobacter sp. SK012]